eukprot:17423-Heterococcus_DN1.PRE.1
MSLRTLLAIMPHVMLATESLQIPVTQTCSATPPNLRQAIFKDPFRGGLEPGGDVLERHIAAYCNEFELVAIETGEHPQQQLLDVEGTIPPELHGTLFRNGPGRSRKDGGQFVHWFDGDGYICKTTFNDGKAYIQTAYVKTDIYKAQEATGEPYPMRRGWINRLVHIVLANSAVLCIVALCKVNRKPFAALSGNVEDNTAALPKFNDAKGGILGNAFRLPANAANTSVQMLGKKLLALWEGGPPYEHSVTVVSTIHTQRGKAMACKRTTAVGSCQASAQEHGTLKSCYSAHPSVCPDTGSIYNLGMQISPPFTLAAMRISPQSETVEQTGTVKLPEMAYVHDNVLTAEYLAFVTPPYVAQQTDLLKSMLGGAPVGKQFK